VWRFPGVGKIVAHRGAAEAVAPGICKESDGKSGFLAEGRALRESCAERRGGRMRREQLRVLVPWRLLMEVAEDLECERADAPQSAGPVR
jgi:hypothetical protein